MREQSVDLGLVEPAGEPGGRAGIEDLLGYEEDPPTERRARRRVGRWLRTIVLAGGLTAVVIAGLRVIGLAISPYAVLAGVLALLLIRRAAAGADGGQRAGATDGQPAGADGGPPPPDRVPGGVDPEHRARDGLDQAVGRWARTLDWASGDADRYENLIRPRLLALARERLRQRHGVTLDTDPDRARVLLGAACWTALTVPERRPPTPRQLAAIIAELEKT